MFELSEYIGIISFSISGFLIALKKHLDYLGIFISSFLTALGGGILRDIIVNKIPYSFINILPGILVLFTFILMLILKIYKFKELESKPIFIISDSIGLVSFSIAGALIAIKYNFNLTGVLTLSFLTAVGGGIARDIIINEVPFIFKTGFYGTIALMIGLVLYIVNYFYKLDFFILLIIFIFFIYLRIFAYYNKWSIPKAKDKDG